MGKLKVISLWAGPGAGKSTTAAALFARMKRLRCSVELVTEYAKDLTYEKSFNKLSNQLHVLAEQNYRLARLEGQAEYAITDSPLPFSLIYCQRDDQSWLEPLIWKLWHNYENFPFLVKRTTAPYVEAGRNQNLEEATFIDRQVADLGTDYGVKLTIDPDHVGVEDWMIGQINGKRGT